MRPLSLLALLTLTAITLFVPSFTHQALASGFVVDTGADAVDAFPGDGMCAAASGECTLRAAIMEANALPGPDTITFQVISPFAINLAIPGRDEDAAATGDLDITGQLTIDGGTSFESMIDGASLDRVFDVHAGADVTIRGLQIVNGDAAEGDGGGIWNQGTLTLDHVAVGSSTADDGGGINNDGTLTLIQSVVLANTAHDVGGGIHNYGMLSIQGGLIEENEGPYGGGGINNFGTLEITGLSLAFNTADSGRGAGLNNFAAARVVDSSINDNHAQLPGGGIANSGELTLTNTTISVNSSATSGAGIFNDKAATATATNTLFADNEGENCTVLSPLVSDHSLEEGTSCRLEGPGDISGTNAQLNPPFELKVLSPAVDSGSNSSCPALDIRGVQRPLDGNQDGTSVCDIGAYELIPSGPPPPLIGDINCSGRIDSIDAALVLQRVALLVGPLVCESNGDVNHDNRLTSVDSALILQFVAGLIDHLPP